MNNNYRYIIVDAQNLFWRCFTIALKRYIFEEKSEIFPEAIYEFLNKYNNFKASFRKENIDVYLLFDNPESTIYYRRLIDENYKSLRFKKSAPKGLYATLKILYQLLQCYDDNLFLVNSDSYEADDLTLPLINTLKIDKNNLCLCVSADLDWSRNIELSPFVEWFNYKEIYTRELFEQKYKFYPDGEKIKLSKSLSGDKSDNIKKVIPRVTNEVIIDIVNNCSTMKEIFVYVSMQKEKFGEKTINKILDARLKLLLNYQLVDFILYESNIKDDVISCKRNIKATKFWFDILELDYESWMIDKNEIVNNFLSKKKKIIKFIT